MGGGWIQQQRRRNLPGETWPGAGGAEMAIGSEAALDGCEGLLP